MKEEWKNVVGSDVYYISNFGNARSGEKNLKIASGRYQSVTTKKMNGGRSLVHRLVAKAFIPNPYNKPCVNHIDADPYNNNVTNLEWCTQKENIHHSSKIGNRHFRGEKSPRAILTQDQVNLIREMYNHSCNQKSRNKPFDLKWLGKCFKVDPSTIGKVISGKNWNG